MEEITFGLKIIDKQMQFISKWKKNNDKDCYIEEIEKNFDELAAAYKNLCNKYEETTSNNIKITRDHLFILNEVFKEDIMIYTELVHKIKGDIDKSIALEELIKADLLYKSLPGRKINYNSSTTRMPETVEIGDRLKVLRLLKNYNKE